MSSLHQTLNEHFVELRAKNPRLSQRYFAQKLGLSSGALSEILKGKRKISPKLAEKIAEKLNMDPRAAAAFVEKTKNDGVGIDYWQLQDDQFQLISFWPHFAILNLVKSKQCQHRSSWFAHQLNLSERVVQDCLDRLLRVGMLKLENKKYIRMKSHLQTSDDILNLSIRKSNQEDLEMLRDQMGVLDISQKDLTSITMLIDLEKMSDMKKFIRRAQDQFMDKFESEQSTNVYRLSVALFPLKKT